MSNDSDNTRQTDGLRHVDPGTRIGDVRVHNPEHETPEFNLQQCKRCTDLQRERDEAIRLLRALFTFAVDDYYNDTDPDGYVKETREFLEKHGV